MTREPDEREGGTPQPTRGSGEPGPERRPPTPHLDEGLLEQGGTVPRLDALDPGESGAPAQSLGAGGGDGPGPGARHEGGAGGSGVRVAGQRHRGSDIANDDAEPAGGGRPAGRPSGA